MHATPTILVAAALLALAGPVAADHEGDYYAEAETRPAETPAERGPQYDCAGSGRPTNAFESIEYNRDEILDGRERWGLPYVAPDCFAFDSSVPMQTPSPCMRWAGFEGTAGQRRIVSCNSYAHHAAAARDAPGGDAMAVSPAPDVYWSYGMSTGRYTVRVDPGNHTFQGNTGLAVSLDCEECDPPL